MQSQCIRKSQPSFSLNGRTWVIENNPPNVRIGIISSPSFKMSSFVEDRHGLVGRLAYASILDITIYEEYSQLDSRFKAIVNFSKGLPYPFYLFILAIFFIQFAGPAFVPDCGHIWPRSHALTEFIRVVAVIFEGPFGDSRVIFCVIFGLLSILVYFTQIPGYIYFHKSQVLPRWQQSFYLAISKYLRPIFLIMMAGGVPDGIIGIKNGGKDSFLSWIFIIEEVLNLILYFYDFPLMSARLLFEDNPKHEWYWTYPVIETITVHILVILSASSDSVPIPVAIAFVFVMAVIYIAFGVYIFYQSPFIHRRICRVISAISFACAGVSLIVGFFHIVEYYNNVLLIISFVLFLIIAMILVNSWNQRVVLKVLDIFDACEATPERTTEIMEGAWSKPNDLIRAVHIAFELWPPALLTWAPCEWSLEKWRDNHELMLMWCRIIAIFSIESEHFRLFVDRYIKMPDHRLQTYYVSQLLRLTSSRITDTTPEIGKQLERCRRAAERIRGLYSRLWKNILQKSVSGFWNDVDAIYTETAKLEVRYKQMLEISPNNFDTACQFCNGMLNITGDIKGYLKLLPKLRRLEQGGVLREDFAVAAASRILQDLKPICGESTKFEMTGRRTHRIVEMDAEVEQLKLGLQNLVAQSKAGKLPLGWIFLVIGTGISLVLCGVFMNMFQSQYCNDISSRSRFIDATSRVFVETSQLVCYIALRPFLQLPRITGVNISDPRLMSETLAPNLGQTGKVAPFQLGDIVLKERIQGVRSCLEAMGESIKQMNNDGDAKIAYDAMYTAETPPGSGLTLQTQFMKVLISAEELSGGLGEAASDEAAEMQSLYEYVTNDRYVEINQFVGLLSGFGDAFFDLMTTQGTEAAQRVDRSLLDI
jgi:hypothetical protein